MSQSPSEFTSLAGDAAYLEGWKALGTMISRGASFSGRERNCCFLNTGGPRFANVSASLALDSIDDSRSVVPIDWDHDGDLDLWYANRTAPRMRFLRNDLPGSNGFIALRLIGTSSNRDGIGARVEVHTGGDEPAIHSRTLRAGDGFVSQTSKWLHVGLGADAKIEKVLVRWPGQDQPQIFTDVDPGHRYRLTQDADQVEVVSARPRLSWKPSELSLPVSSDIARVLLTRRSILPALRYTDSSGNRRKLNSLMGAVTGKALLVNLWASWCPNCLAELKELADATDSLSDQNLEILALSADGIASDEPADRDKEQRMLDQLGWTARRGVATESLIEHFTKLLNQAVYQDRPLPLPTSFLIDGWGRVAVIYKGPVSAKQLSADLQYALLDVSDEQLRAASFPFPGRTARPLFPMTAADIAGAYRDGGYIDDARRVLNDDTAGRQSGTGSTRDPK